MRSAPHRPRSGARGRRVGRCNAQKSVERRLGGEKGQPTGLAHRAAQNARDRVSDTRDLNGIARTSTRRIQPDAHPTGHDAHGETGASQVTGDREGRLARAGPRAQHRAVMVGPAAMSQPVLKLIVPPVCGKNANRPSLTYILGRVAKTRLPSFGPGRGVHAGLDEKLFQWHFPIRAAQKNAPAAHGWSRVGPAYSGANAGAPPLSMNSHAVYGRMHGPPHRMHGGRRDQPAPDAPGCTPARINDGPRGRRHAVSRHPHQPVRRHAATK